MKKIKNKIRNIKYRCYKIVCESKLFKVNSKKIIFDNFNGKGFGCNPKYIALELIRQNVDCEMFWIVNDMGEEFPKEIKKVKRHSFKAYYNLATAKIWVDNVRNYKGIDKKDNQFYIQTWHASLGIKKVEREVEELLSKKYVENAKNDGKITNLMFVNNNIMYNLFKKDFWYNGNIIKVGLPRNDILYNMSPAIMDKIYNYYKIDKQNKIAIYAPTFRKEMNCEVFKFDYNNVIKALEKKFNNQYVMLIRLHPNVASHSGFIEYSNKVIDASDYPDMQELLAASDIAITDFSSIAFDMSMAKKKVLIFAKDYDEYIKNERGLSIDFSKLPFKVSKSEEELCSIIESFSNKEYMEKCEAFYNKIGLVNNSNSASEIVSIIKDKMGV